MKFRRLRNEHLRNEVWFQFFTMKATYFNTFAILCCVCYFFSCNSKTESNRDVEIIHAKPDIKENASNIFEQIKVIPLETTDSSLVGKSIERIEIWNGKLFVHNYIGLEGYYSHTNILCFDLSGKFLFKIDRLGQGPGEYTHLADFFVDEHLQRLFFISENRRFLYFDLNGNFLYDIYSDEHYYARHSIYLNDSTYLFLNDVSEPSSDFEEFSLLYVDAATMNVRHKTNSINEFYWTGSKPLSKYGDRILCHTVNDSIFDISDSANVKPVYYFHYTDIQAKSRNAFRKVFNEIDYRDRLRYFDYDNTYDAGQSILVQTMYENSKYLVFGCMKTDPGDASRSIQYVLFYDKKSKKTYDSGNINFDGFILKNITVLGTCDESFYCVLSSEITGDDKEKIKTSKAFSDEDKKTLLEHKFDDNPLLFVLK